MNDRLARNRGQREGGGAAGAPHASTAFNHVFDVGARRSRVEGADGAAGRKGETGKWGIETVGGGAARLCVERSGEIRGAEGAEQFAVVAGGHRDERGSEGDEEGGLEGVGDGIVE